MTGKVKRGNKVKKKAQANPIFLVEEKEFAATLSLTPFFFKPQKQKNKILFGISRGASFTNSETVSRIDIKDKLE